MKGLFETTGNRRLLILSWLAVSVVLSLIHLRDLASDLADPAYLVASAGAVAIAWVATGWLRGSDRAIGALIAAALTASYTGELISRYLGWQRGGEPEASVADLAWGSCYVLLGAALLLLLRRGGPRHRRDIDGLIDVAAITVAGLLVAWELAVSAALRDASVPMSTRLLWGMYPVFDLAILVLAVRLFLRDRTVASLLIAGGVLLGFSADVAYAAIADASSYSALLDGAWLWSGIAIALAVVAGPRRALQAGRRRHPSIHETGIGRILVAFLPLLVPAALELHWLMRDRDTNSIMIALGAIALVLLAFIRVARLARYARWARQALASQQRYASALAANSSDAVAVVDADLKLVKNFPRLAALIGRPGADLSGMDLLSLVLPADREEIRAAMQRCLASPDQVFYVEMRIAGSGERPTWLAARVVNLLADPDVRGVVVNLHDISDRKRAEAGLTYQAFHDALTGLPNRALFRDRLDHVLDRASGDGTTPAVLFLDLDGFKAVNDGLGHDAGDALLREVAARLRTAAQRGDTVGRLGGDEFAILIEQGDDPRRAATETAARALQALREPIHLDRQYVAISASIGIAIGDHASSSSDLLRNADVAMYRAKSTGKNRWVVYRPGMRSGARERLEWETGLRMALKRGDLRLYYQPVVELASERVVGLETLLRWQHPQHGLVEPDRFIPLAEETGMIVPIGRWVLEEATRAAAGWAHHTADGEPLTIAVNLSARQLEHTDLVDDVTRALAAAGLPAERLILEITETALVSDPVAAADQLQRLRRSGVRLAIDDFGTGYSSLNYLRHFPIDILKIDRSFIQSIPAHGEFPPIVGGLLDLGRSLHFQTLAEGVELEYQRDRLAARQCDLAQGFLFARPMPPAEAAHFLATRSHARDRPQAPAERPAS